MKRIQLDNRSDLSSEIPLEAPYSIFIDPSSYCNFRCSFCMNQHIERPKIMDKALFEKIIDDLQEFENKVKTIRLYGFGEPLLNINFCHFVEYAKKSSKVISVDTTTNASLLNSELIRKIVDSGIDRINISIEAVGTENYRKFTRNNRVTYEGIIKNIEELFKLKKDIVIFTKINGDYLDEVSKQEFIATFSPISDGCDIEHTMSCWRDFDVAEVNTEVGIYGQPLKEVMVCPYVFYSFLIHADGTASACFLDWNKQLVIGNADNESVKSLWGSPKLNDLRRIMISKERKSYAACKKCNQLVAGMPVDLDDKAEQIKKRLGISKCLKYFI